jgi:uncharacterized protein YbjT (DUF2867 family)
MSASVLVVGATGNTGVNVVKTLATHISSSEVLANHRIIAVTRSRSNTVAQELAKLPRVDVEEISWPTITSQWLKDRKVDRAFVASHNLPHQFADESAFYVAALEAEVGYIVRISTTAANVTPTYPAYYPRQHWAVEALLDSPAFEKLRWTSLQPNVFDTFALQPAVEFVKEERRKVAAPDGPLRLLIAEDVPVGTVNPGDVGILAAKLLLLDDTLEYNKSRLEVNGPENITGKQVVELANAELGRKIDAVQFKDLTAIEALAANAPTEVRHIMRTIKFAPITVWNGECTVSTTSAVVLKIAPPKTTLQETFKALLLQ